MALIGSDRVRAVVGLGKTGLACVEFLARQGLEFYVVDSRDTPPGLEAAQALCPAENIFTGSLEPLLTLGVTELYVSPGIPLAHPVLQQLAAQGVQMRGDIDLFKEHANAPIVAITGSNAKSTVTTLVDLLLRAVGKRSVAGGNLGDPALTLLADDMDFYVLELSSFQLETTTDLGAKVACVLNVSEDHMDRYPNLLAYQKAKQRIYQGCQGAVCNKQDILTVPLLQTNVPVRAFTTGQPDLYEYGLLQDDDLWLCRGVERLYKASDIRLQGKHNLANVLSCLAMVELCGVDPKHPAIAEVLASFAGLPHRCEHVATVDGVTYINDSKGTNVGATLAALQGFGSAARNIHLIAGGDGKGADFKDLARAAKQFVKHSYLFGKDAAAIEQVLEQQHCGYSRYRDLEEIFQSLKATVAPGDIVLFSPACASLDMYKNFEARGEHFCRLVGELPCSVV
ncbi:UDP-N-acetylmuramoyl-L-alanine--D-glutamate ligase [Maribrevibacterium harenarium]|uniref:UDP-N-acetylmuramoylalanine--D-glutamate ligase n=1 Tax=Maribrevibacterium harenarium TaxID=2589817 RepID=A0A501WRJ5_9GAMM|nr:UDP-N-acetylmuramoyl-L-alanine--D-glutamate ligase [Maribrevibacterium harenarium]TPE51978.1 UDP-N-acetylmuramoyl-L-alanine--D-glutamate ligase [Maribrevibacterium harenarium]